ncbi:MAG TPA: hypothetical protein VNF74_08945 [Terriglobales bacterium]|nr:hypothetical protein [Terriglobales bacterium]
MLRVLTGQPGQGCFDRAESAIQGVFRVIEREAAQLRSRGALVALAKWHCFKDKLEAEARSKESFASLGAGTAEVGGREV